MIRAALLDLDDTLLQNDMAGFLPVYLRSLGESLADLADPGRLAAEVMAGTRDMLVNRDPRRTLQDVFAARFYPAMGWNEPEVRPRLLDYYQNEFPHLQDSTRPIPAAVELVQALQQAGVEVAIATNPLFPRLAVEHRLAWAGLAVAQFHFALLSSFEELHFAKPHAEYYTEVLGRLGVRAHEAAMLGNEYDNDIRPALELGVATYHVSDKPRGTGGTLAGALDWLRDPDLTGDPSAAHRPGAILAMMRGHLGALLGMASSLSPGSWGQRPKPGEWSAGEILCHLRDVEREVNLPRLRRLLTEQDPFISAVDPDRWAEPRGYRRQSGPEALTAFTEARLETLGLLGTLAPEAWAKPARHSLLGPTRLSEIFSVAAEHDLLHLAQLRRTLAAVEHHPHISS
jgi:FMN phosphatase YigB (HAD superfamily)